jgi:hypothetical protein
LKRLIKKANVSQKDMKVAQEIIETKEVPDEIKNEDVSYNVQMLLLRYYYNAGTIDKKVFKQIKERGIEIPRQIIDLLARMYMEQMIKSENTYLSGYTQIDSGREYYIPLRVEHGDKNRDAAIAYFDGEFYEKPLHSDAVREFQQKNGFKDPEYGIYAHKVDQMLDGTGKNRCIYIVEPMLSGFKTVQEAAQKLKEKYPQYAMYSDDDGFIDIDDDFKAKYGLILAKVKKMFQKIGYK